MRLLESLQDIVALIRDSESNLQKQRVIMNELVNISIDAVDFSEIKIFIEEMHHASLCQQNFFTKCFYEVGRNIVNHFLIIVPRLLLESHKKIMSMSAFAVKEVSQFFLQVRSQRLWSRRWSQRQFQTIRTSIVILVTIIIMMIKKTIIFQSLRSCYSLSKRYKSRNELAWEMNMWRNASSSCSFCVNSSKRSRQLVWRSHTIGNFEHMTEQFYYYSILASTFFRFLVDHDRRLLTIHSSLIAHHSKFLDLLVNEYISKTKKKCALLKDVEEQTFVQFSQYAYIENYSAADSDIHFNTLWSESFESLSAFSPTFSLTKVYILETRLNTIV